MNGPSPQVCSYGARFNTPYDSESGHDYTWNVVLQDLSSGCGNYVNYGIRYRKSGDCTNVVVTPGSVSMREGGTGTISVSASVEDGGTCTVYVDAVSPDGNVVASGTYVLNGPTVCTPGWVCDGSYREYQDSNCDISNKEYCPNGCSNGQCIENKGIVYGSVYDSRHNRIFGATVTCGGYSETTNIFGKYSMAVSSGYYTCTARKDGYRPSSSYIYVKSGSSNELDFVLSKENVCTERYYCNGNDVWHEDEQCNSVFVDHCEECLNGRCVSSPTIDVWSSEKYPKVGESVAVTSEASAIMSSITIYIDGSPRKTCHYAKTCSVLASFSTAGTIPFYAVGKTFTGREVHSTTKYMVVSEGSEGGITVMPEIVSETPKAKVMATPHNCWHECIKWILLMLLLFILILLLVATSRDEKKKR